MMNRRNETEPLRFTEIRTGFSWLPSLTWVESSKGLCRLTFGPAEKLSRDSYLTQHFPKATYEALSAEDAAKAKSTLQSFWNGEDVSVLLKNLSLDVRSSDFDRLVWETIREIPHGSTMTYGELAAQIQRPKAARAVGGASGRNPVPLLIPCHRVVGAKGALTGFTGGLSLKSHLLMREQELRHCA